jgi:hypothetical protein
MNIKNKYLSFLILFAPFTIPSCNNDEGYQTSLPLASNSFFSQYCQDNGPEATVMLLMLPSGQQNSSCSEVYDYLKNSKDFNYDNESEDGEKILSLLREFTNIETLELQKTGLKILSSLETFSSLKNLTVSNNRKLTKIEKLPCTLNYLDLSHTALDEEHGFDFLTTLPNLEILLLEGYSSDIESKLRAKYTLPAQLIIFQEDQSSDDEDQSSDDEDQSSDDEDQSSDDENQSSDDEDQSSDDENGFDPKGYDRDGYNREGYNRKGWHKTTGLHEKTETHFDENGITQSGKRYDANDFDWAGFNSLGFNGAGLTRWGNNVIALSDPCNHPNCWITRDFQGREREIRGGITQGFDLNGHNEFGYNLKGFYRELPYGGLQLDIDSLDRDSNYLGLIHVFQFYQFGWDALILGDRDGRQNKSLRDLATDYNTHCFDLMDTTEGDLYDLEDAEFEENFCGNMTAAADIYIQDRNYTEAKLKLHLRKAIYFCENFLRRNSELPKDLNTFRYIARDQRLTDKTTRVDYAGEYQKLLDELMQEPGETEVTLYNRVKGYFKGPYLAEARYPEDFDQRMYGNYLINKQNHIDQFIDAYSRLDNRAFYLDVRAQEEGKLTLLLLAKFIKQNRISNDDMLAMNTPNLLHGGVHCLDARHSALDEIRKEPNLKKIFDGYSRKTKGLGLQSQLRGEISKIKEEKFTNWLRTLAGQFAPNEQETSIAATWDRLGPQLGFHPQGTPFGAMHLETYINNHLVRVSLDSFLQQKNLNGGYGGDYTVEYLIQNIGFSVGALQQGSLAQLKTIDNLARGIFGPLVATFDGTNPLTRALLVRFGYITNVPPN